MATKKPPAKKAPKKTGRPSSFTQAVADRICTRLVDGESLRTICLSDRMPNITTVLRWLGHPDREAFRTQYARAREAQAERLAEEILQIADDGANDTYQADDGEAVNHDVIARSRLRVDARKWLAGKLAPKKYGDKIAVGGAEDLPPVLFQKIERTVVDPANPDA